MRVFLVIIIMLFKVTRAYACMQVFLIAPLHNFGCDKRLVKLDENVCIRHVRKNEIKDLLNRTPVPWYYEALEFELSSVEFVVEEKQKTKKGLPYKLETESVGNVLLALRLLKRADIDSPCSFLLDKEKDLVASLGLDLAKTGYSENPYSLKKSEIPDLVRLWSKLKEVDAKPHLHFSLHEFLSAFETHTIEDRIYHCVVGLESLVFYNIDKTFPYKGILIGLAVGMLLGTNQKQRDEIKETIKKAYEIRNGVVHGTLKKLQKHLKDSEEISHRLEDYLRNTLKKLLLEELS